MAQDAKGHGSDARGGQTVYAKSGGALGPAHQSMIRKVLATGDVHGAMAHAITGYDRQQQARSDLKGTYYNPNTLGLALGAAERAAKDIRGGASHADAINNHFNGGLARTLHKALGTGGTDVDTMRAERFK